METGVSKARYIWLAVRILAGWRPLPREPTVTVREIRAETRWKARTAHIKAHQTLMVERDTSEICLWLNRGFTADLIKAPGEVRVRESLDPEFKVMKMRRIEVKGSFREGEEVEVEFEYKGRASPLVDAKLGYTGYGHIYKQEVLWMPMPSCRSLIPLLISRYPRLVELSAKASMSLEAASSIWLQRGDKGVLEGHREGWAEPPSIIVAPMEQRMLGDKYRVWLHRGLPAHPPLSDIHEILREVDEYYEDEWGLKSPYSSIDVVMLPGGGGWTSGSMHALNASRIKGKAELAAQILHEAARRWWGMRLVPGDSGSYWLLEAIPDYAVLHGLGRLGYNKLAEKYLREAKLEARRMLGSWRYRPPTLIPLPITSREQMIARIIGSLILYEAGEKCGHNMVTEALSPTESPGDAHIFTWPSIRMHLLEQCRGAEEIVKKYRV